LISTTTTLKKSYISYLATNDIFTIIKNQKWPLTKEDFLNLESVKALAFFKVHSIYEKPISIYKTLISRLFEQYSSLRFFFTGLLMDKLLSESK
jgi:hypothetical protein